MLLGKLTDACHQHCLGIALAQEVVSSYTLILQNSVMCSLLPPSSTASGDIPEPPQCDQLVDCSWSEQPNQYDSSGQGIPVESALEATEFTVRAMESESRQVSIKRNKSNLEGGVAIEMSAQPLLELTPMPGSEYRTRLQRSRI